MTTEDQVKQLDEQIGRLSREANALHVAKGALANRIEAARAAARRAQLDGVIEPSPEAQKAVAARVAEVEALLEEESAAIERSRILTEALAELRAQRAPLAAQADTARLAAAKVALRERIARRATDFAGFVRDVIALDRLESRLPQGYPDNRVLEHAAKIAGTSAGALNDHGRAFGAALLAGRAEV